MKLKCVTDMSVTSSQAKISPVYSKAQTVKINSRYKGKSIADCFDFLQLICPLGSFPMYELYDILICRTLGRFLSLESQNQVCLLLEVGGRLVSSSFQLEITFFL